jgi:hypothetical protein
MSLTSDEIIAKIFETEIEPGDIYKLIIDICN